MTYEFWLIFAIDLPMISPLVWFFRSGQGTCKIVNIIILVSNSLFVHRKVQSSVYENKISKLAFIYHEVFVTSSSHYREKRGLCLMKWPSQKLQDLSYFWNTVSAQIGGRRLIKKLRFYGEILLNKMLSNWQILLNKVLTWRFNQEWPVICADTVIHVLFK